jgi:ATP-binding cassette subfamily B protein
MKVKYYFPFIKAAGMMECGPVSLAMIFKYYGIPNVRALLNDLTDVTTDGTDLYTLSKVAEGCRWLST